MTQSYLLHGIATVLLLVAAKQQRRHLWAWDHALILPRKIRYKADAPF